MKESIRNSLTVGEKPFTAPVQFYSTMEEINKAAGDVQIPVDRLNGWLHAHGTAGDLRDLIVEATIEVTGQKPKETKSGKKDKKGADIMVVEHDTVFVNRVVPSDPTFFDKIQKLVTQRARGLTHWDSDKKAYVETAKGEEGKYALAVDISRKISTGGKGKELAKKWTEMALNFILGRENPKTKKPYNMAGLQKALKAQLDEEYTPVAGIPKDDAQNVDRLGRLCKAYSEALEAEKFASV